MRIFTTLHGTAAQRLAPAMLLIALAAPTAFAQDTSGNGLLNGAYRFRYVATVNYSNIGNVTETTAAQGVITFDGNGNYTITGGSQYIDNALNGGRFQTYPSGANAFTGQYAFNAAGIGLMHNVDPYIQGALANAGASSASIISGSCTQIGTTPPCTVLMGSSTLSATQTEQYTGLVVTDVFVAVLAGSPPTNASFNSPYWIGSLDFAGGTDIAVKNSLFEIMPNGSGGLGSITVNGQANNKPGSALQQTISGGAYNFASDGNAQFNLPAPSGVPGAQVMVSGSRTMYESSDGAFLLGWTPNGYDILFGIKALTKPATSSLFDGLYYTAGLADTPPLKGQAQCGTLSFWGSTNARGSAYQVDHKNTFEPFCASFTDSYGIPYPTDKGLSNSTTVNPDGTATDDFGNLYVFGAGGSAFVSIADPSKVSASTGGYFSFMIGVQANFAPASGVWLSPAGIVNQANWDPITAAVAPGELISLFGNFGTVKETAVPGGQPCNNSLSSVSVMVGGVAAPVCYVSSHQLNIQAPWELYSQLQSGSFTAQVQVNNGGMLSNSTSIYLTDANSGFFTQQSDGVGEAVAEHLNGTLITQASPAAPGETIVLALGGMGQVNPTVSDGVIGPSSPLSNATVWNQQLLGVFFNDYINTQVGQQGTVSFAGLYPSFVGLYQMNVKVPTSIGTNSAVYIEVVTDAADVEQVTIPISASGAAFSGVSAAQVHPASASRLQRSRRRAPIVVPRSQFDQVPRRLRP